MKKKLLFVITQFYKGGAEVSLLNLFKNLDKNKYDIDFVILNQNVMSDVESLVDKIPDWIHIYDVYKVEKKNIYDCVIKKIYRKLFKADTSGRESKRLLKNKKYDVAFSYGEWLSPRFVTKNICAKKKYIWIHIDIDKANFVNKSLLTKYDLEITGYIFPSNTTEKAAVAACPTMKRKTHVIHNFIDISQIMDMSNESIGEIKSLQPYLLSVGNLRVEKNYLRQIEIMHILKKRACNVKWICIGSTVNEKVYKEARELIAKYGLENDFILYGANDNPYKYMKYAEAVMVLSDYESWSLVISEAKILNVPVIATNTSGAQEQIVNGKNGIITSFDKYQIADTIQSFLNDSSLHLNIISNLKMENKKLQIGKSEFERLVDDDI